MTQQGSVLGPTLFVYCINDMDVINCLVKIFADDTKVYTDALSSEQRTMLQSSVDRLLVWSNDRQAKFNSNTC